MLRRLTFVPRAEEMAHSDNPMLFHSMGCGCVADVAREPPYSLQKIIKRV